MNDGHVLVIIAAFVVVQMIAVGGYKYLRSCRDCCCIKRGSA